jgi:hypothetical protein
MPHLGTDYRSAHEEIPLLNTCYFCGPTENPLTEEHVWPQWMSKLLPKYDSDHFVHYRHVGASTVGRWESSHIKVTTRTVCDKCNNVWLSNFENTEVMPIAAPLITGISSAILTPANQWTLAAWAYKMAMLLEVAVPENRTEFFTAAERQQFRETTLADQRVCVFLAKYKFGQHPGHAHVPEHDLTARDGDRKSYELKISTMTVGALGMQVMAVRSKADGQLTYASEIEFEFSQRAKDAVIPIWPPTGSAVRWPPAETMTRQDIEDWTDMWRTAEGMYYAD